MRTAVFVITIIIIVAATPPQSLHLRPRSLRPPRRLQMSFGESPLLIIQGGPFPDDAPGAVEL